LKEIKTMTGIAVAGAAGRMGQALISAVSGNSDLELTHVFERPGHALLGTDAGVLVGADPMGIPLTDAIGSQDFDLLIDFTSPIATMAHLVYCQSQSKRMVIGTTGIDVSYRSKIAFTAGNIGIVMAPNMSIGINLMLKLIELAARTLGDTADIEIIEAHHRQKIDAPSGTALLMGKVAADVLERDLITDGVYSRHGQIGERGTKTIGFSTIRAGDMVGEHSVWFVSSGERVEISHKATSRAIYAAGAVRAALWLVGRPNGLYDMQDVLGFSD
jgi:4-hydroxy-tetrahydrodipicolinate reductase